MKIRLCYILISLRKQNFGISTVSPQVQPAVDTALPTKTLRLRDMGSLLITNASRLAVDTSESDFASSKPPSINQIKQIHMTGIVSSPGFSKSQRYLVALLLSAHMKVPVRTPRSPINQPARLASPHCRQVSHFPFQKSLMQLTGAKDYWHGTRCRLSLIKEKTFRAYTCVCKVLFRPAGVGTKAEGIEGARYQKPQVSNPRERLERGTTAAVNLQNYFFERFKAINIVRRTLMCLLLFHVLSKSE